MEDKDVKVPACIKCKYFGIIHPQVTEMESKPNEEKLAFIQMHMQSHGYCMRSQVVNPISGQIEHRLAFYERLKQQYRSILELSDHCGEEGKYFEPAIPTKAANEEN